MESLNQASWSEDVEVQKMWAGLLASSCTADGKDDSNWIFINLLGGLTPMQVAILRYACENAEKFATEHGFIQAQHLMRNAEELQQIAQCSDIHRIDRELDHLHSVGLIAGGFEAFLGNPAVGNIAPTALALHLYVRAQGSLKNPIEFFNLTTTGPSTPLRVS